MKRIYALILTFTMLFALAVMPVSAEEALSDDIVILYTNDIHGYIDGVIAEDGEEQDAYILGVNEPVKKFSGKVIAIIHRFDDIEEKLVVAPEGASFSKDEIMHQVNFQEGFFNIEIRM